ncbi:unnamed protein product, partial [Protopolystoma xenopodis]
MWPATKITQLAYAMHLATSLLVKAKDHATSVSMRRQARSPLWADKSIRKAGWTEKIRIRFSFRWSQLTTAGVWIKGPTEMGLMPLGRVERQRVEKLVS